MGHMFVISVVVRIGAHNIAGGVDAIGPGGPGARKVDVGISPSAEQEGMADFAQKILPDNRAGRVYVVNMPSGRTWKVYGGIASPCGEDSRGLHPPYPRNAPRYPRTG